MRTGFTLVELIITVAILAILSAVAYVSIIGQKDHADAGKVVLEFDGIKAAFNLWMVDVGITVYPDQDDYGTTGALPCQDEPALSATDLFTNVHGYAGWDGPYLSSTPKTPWGVEYTYDNDGDLWPNDGVSAGVNLYLQWCTRAEGERAQQVAPLVDDKIDRGDGRSTGRVRWSSGTSSGSLRILLAPEGE